MTSLRNDDGGIASQNGNLAQSSKVSKEKPPLKKPYQVRKFLKNFFPKISGNLFLMHLVTIYKWNCELCKKYIPKNY